MWKMTTMGKCNRRSTQAFTLVELLVVIGIIAVLISILLPALSSARRSANTVKDMANLRSIAQAMQIYTTENRGWLAGAAVTTGVSAQAPAANANCRYVSHLNDWQAPLARVLKIPFNEGATINERRERFRGLMSHPAFTCPENNAIAVPLGTPIYDAMQAPSYILAVQFFYVHKPSSVPNGDPSVGETTTYSFHNPPAGYAPKIGKVGPPSRKIMIACGGKYTDASTPAVRAPLTLRYDWGGAFGDRGPWYIFNKAWDRINAPGNGGVSTFDPRVHAYRHGKRVPNGPADQFKFTAAFFDGHVEVLGDLEGADPALWNPTGTTLEVADNRVFADVKRRYFNDVDGFYTLP
jgi:prepilin-type N-terminal cleavage/methylation domain-containing protein/prepilin-type processing-associated H-X9-DG protein